MFRPRGGSVAATAAAVSSSGVLLSKFGEGRGARDEVGSSPLPASLLPALLRFRMTSLLFPAASRRESPASLGGLGRGWRRLASQDTLASLPSSLLPSPPSRGGEAPGAGGISQEGGNHRAFQPRPRVSVDQEAR